MITYKELTPELLFEYAESYKTTMSVLRPSLDISAQGLVDSFDKMLQQGSKVFIAQHEMDGLIGTLTLLVEQKMLRNGAISGHLEDLCIQSGYQGEGIGSSLVKLATQAAKEAGCYKVILDCSKELTSRYARFGYQESEINMKLYTE